MEKKHEVQTEDEGVGKGGVVPTGFQHHETLGMSAPYMGVRGGSLGRKNRNFLVLLPYSENQCLKSQEG